MFSMFAAAKKVVLEFVAGMVFEQGDASSDGAVLFMKAKGDERFIWARIDTQYVKPVGTPESRRVKHGDRYTDENGVAQICSNPKGETVMVASEKDKGAYATAKFSDAHGDRQVGAFCHLMNPRQARAPREKKQAVYEF